MSLDVCNPRSTISYDFSRPDESLSLGWVAALGLRSTAEGSWSISGAWDFFGMAVLGQFEEREDSALRSAVLIPVLAIAPRGPVALSRVPEPVHQLPRM